MKKTILLKSLLLLCALIVGSSYGWAQPYKMVYTLTPTQSGSNTAYGTYYDVTINEITWNAPGNQNFSGKWRIGGKNLSGVDRVIKGKTPISKAISKITFNHAGRTNAKFTVKSVTLTVASDAAFSSIIETKELKPSISVSTSGSFDYIPTEPLTSWASNSYYKFTINCSNSESSNYGLDLTSIVFYETTSSPQFSADNVELEYNDTEGEMSYSLANPVDGAVVTATSTDDWISNISVESATTVSFNVSPNDGAVDRVGTITLNYVKDATTLTTKDVTITQGHYDLAYPVCSPAAGYYNTDQSVEISCETAGSSIYYTTDGSDPTTSSTLYSGAIPVSKNTTIKVMSFKEGHSRMITADYIIDATYANFTWDLSTDKTTTASTDELTWGGTYASMELVKATSTTNANNYYPGTSGQSYKSTRFYKDQILTITPASSYVIKSIVFTAMSDAYATTFQNSTWTNATAVASGSTVTVTPVNGGTDIVANITGTCGFSAVKVYYSENEYVSIGSSKYASYCTKRNLDFSASDVKAYKAKVESNQVKLTKVTKVPADEGVILYCDAPGTYNIPVTATATALTDNEMVGVTEETTVAWYQSTKYNYILQQGTFKKATGGKLRANRAYLSTSYNVTAPGAQELEIVFDEEEGDVTGIAELSVKKEFEGEYFNLNGQRVDASHKGIVIVNGKKFFNK